tara:strand:- start:7346 stop:8278 length:933 start_codon:yes stop_codon:yes gene_type:complete
MIKKKDKIFLAGHAGLLGSSIYRNLKKQGYVNIVTATKKKLDLRDQKKVQNFIKKNKPKLVIIAAAKVGGIYANNKYRAEFLYDNLEIQNNLINSSHENNVNELIFFGSSCIYPRNSKQPIKEKYLLTGQLEYTNEPYAIAKIAGIKMCENYNLQYGRNYKCLMPTNTYGPNDNYNLKSSHFYPALIKKIHLAKLKKKKYIEVWGTGKVKRELIFVDDIANACIFFMNKRIKEVLINIGVGKDYSIDYYVKYLKKIFNFFPKTQYLNKISDGTPKKLLDISLAKKYGWKPKTSLRDGTNITIKEYLSNFE